MFIIIDFDPRGTFSRLLWQPSKDSLAAAREPVLAHVLVVVVPLELRVRVPLGLVRKLALASPPGLELMEVAVPASMSAPGLDLCPAVAAVFLWVVLLVSASGRPPSCPLLEPRS